MTKSMTVMLLALPSLFITPTLIIFSIIFYIYISYKNSILALVIMLELTMMTILAFTIFYKNFFFNILMMVFFLLVMSASEASISLSFLVFISRKWGKEMKSKNMI